MYLILIIKVQPSYIRVELTRSFFTESVMTTLKAMKGKIDDSVQYQLTIDDKLVSTIF